MTKSQRPSLAFTSRNEVGQEVLDFIEYSISFDSTLNDREFLIGQHNPGPVGTWKLGQGPAKVAIEEESKHGKIDYVLKMLKNPLLWKAKGKTYFVTERAPQYLPIQSEWEAIRETEESETDK